MFICNAVSRAMQGWIKNYKIIIQPLSIKNHHFAKLTATDNTDLMHVKRSFYNDIL